MSNKTPSEQPKETESEHSSVPQNKKRYLVFGVVLVILGCLAVYNGVSSLFDNTIRLLAPNGFITVEVVDTPELRTLGLSGRESLSDGEGMLFEFTDSSQDNCFWMKEMKFSIDMVWMNSEKEVVTVISDVSPDTYPENFCPTEPALYGLEISSGRVETLEIDNGTKLRW
jgi:uncharacterized membrane protein (UPF0127 family)